MSIKENERIVIATGGNALTGGPGKETIEDQREAAAIACEIVAKIFMQCGSLALTHGNGPQVGFILQRAEYALKHGVLHQVPLDAINADTQGAIGYMLEQLLVNRLQANPLLAERVSTLVTQIQVDPKDKAFQNPDKPVGSWLTKEEAMSHKKTDEWDVKLLKPNTDRPWRRVVPSPIPKHIVNIGAIKHNLNGRYLTICCGGGGIPVVRKPDGTFEGIEGVIDKDRATALLAELVRADLMAVLTAVPGVMDPEEFKNKGDKGIIIPKLTTKEATDMLSQLQKGSMGPKVEACLKFTEATGKPSLITDFSNALSSILEGKGGTRIVASKGITEV